MMYLPRVFHALVDRLVRHSDEHGQSLVEVGFLMGLIMMISVVAVGSSALGFVG
jgi:hypothetical protein